MTERIVVKIVSDGECAAATADALAAVMRDGPCRDADGWKLLLDLEKALRDAVPPPMFTPPGPAGLAAGDLSHLFDGGVD